VISDALRRACVVFTVSHTLQRELIEHLGAPADKLVATLNGCDHLPLEARQPAHDAPLLCVGHLEPRKNIATLLRALALAPDLGRLQLAGAAKGDERQRLERLVRELGLTERVEFLGLQDDRALARLYARCRAVVLPSLREGFDLPLAEALRAGAPVACSDLAVHRELAGEGACYFDPTSSAALVDALRAARAPHAAPQLPSWDEAAHATVAAWISAVGRR
jgi:glycosyltransferase involved in cell wall biosynthesis